MSNNFYAILAWCWWLGLRVSLILSDLKLLQGLDSLFFSILRNCHSILYKVKMFIIVWVSWSHSCCFHSFRSTTKYWWDNLKNHSYLQIKAWGKCFICNKDIWCEWCIKFDKWWMKNAYATCKNMEQCSFTNRSSVLRGYPVPWANRW